MKRNTNNNDSNTISPLHADDNGYNAGYDSTAVSTNEFLSDVPPMEEEVEVPPLSKEFVMKSVKGYVYSRRCIELCCLIVICISLFLLSGLFKLHERDIPYQILEASGDVILDFNFNHEAKKEQISDTLLVLCFLGIPLMSFALLELCCRNGCFFHDGSCALFSSSAVTLSLTNFLKRYTGYFRPNFYDRCGFDVNTLQCTASSDTVEDGRQSFISGHASSSFCGLTVLFLVLLGAWKARENKMVSESRRKLKSEIHLSIKNYTFEKLLFAPFIVTPILLATYISSTRLVDNYHHEADVVAGGFLGALIGSFGYHIYYPQLISNKAGTPKRY